MDRDEKDNLPKMQIGFIDSICLPLYRVNTCWDLLKNPLKYLTFLILGGKGTVGIIPLGQTYL